MLEVSQYRRVPVETIRGDRHHIVIRSKLELAGHANAPRMLQIPETPKSPSEALQGSLWQAEKALERSLVALQEIQSEHAVVIMDQGHVVGGQDIVDQRDHLVADALDAMRAAAVVERAWSTRAVRARRPLHIRETRLDFVARGQRSRRSRRGDERGHAAIAVTRGGFERAPAGHIAVEAVVRQQLELRQNLVAGSFLYCSVRSSTRMTSLSEPGVRSSRPPYWRMRS